MSSQIDTVVSRARASLATAGLTVVGEDLARPWGGFLLIAQSDIKDFIRVYFPAADLQDAHGHLALSPKLLLVASGRRLSWQYHRRRKVLLAHLPHYVREERLGELVLPARTSNTITRDSELREELARVGERGIGRDDQEHHPGLISLAAPVRDEWGETAAVSLSASAQNVSLETLVGTAQGALLATAWGLSARLGYRTSASGSP